MYFKSQSFLEKYKSAAKRFLAHFYFAVHGLY